jgi:hypothetical protein
MAAGGYYEFEPLTNPKRQPTAEWSIIICFLRGRATHLMRMPSTLLQARVRRLYSESS